MPTTIAGALLLCTSSLVTLRQGTEMWKYEEIEQNCSLFDDHTVIAIIGSQCFTHCKKKTESFGICVEPFHWCFPLRRYDFFTLQSGVDVQCV